ncbi:MAG: Xaa-Pro peptidase family protein [Oscillospiraceae bacterium]|jgi:Xaa-Pro aminopeptidase|nr:Xaa-Pro peptidase family protein [Oscillospiraceae bacterium]
MTDRGDKLLALLMAADVQGALVHKPSNMRYLSGYTGEGLLVLADGIRAVVTDFRYTEQAEQQAPGYSVHMTDSVNTAEKVAAGLLAGLTVVAFEDDEVTVKGMGKLSEAMPKQRFVPMNHRVEMLRTVKDAAEIALIEKACAISCLAFEDMLSFIAPGRTELEVRFALENALYRHGAEKLAFDTIVATGANGSLPHAIPGNRVIEKGHLVTMDFGARVGGYCADITRTVAVGSLGDAERHVYETVLQAQLLALDAIRPGANCRAVDKIARDFIDQAGYKGRFGHGLGHSLGLDIHESPRLSTACDDTLQPGMLMTNEPGIYLPGQCGCRIEDTVLVTEDGCRRLTTAGKELIIL